MNKFKLFLIILTLILCMGCFGVSGANIGENPYLHIPLVTDGYVSLEAEDAVRGDYEGISEINHAEASGGAFITFTTDAVTDISKATPNPALRFDANVRYGGIYFVWLRFKAESEGSNSVYYSIDSASYTDKHFTAKKGEWQWIKLAEKNFESGIHSVAFKKREKNFCIDKIIITADSGFEPVAADSLPDKLTPDKIPVQTTYDTTNLLKPVKGHPRVFITPDYVEKLKEYVKTPELSKAWSSVKSSASKNIVSLLPENKTTDENGNEKDLGSYNSSVLNSIQCRALLYAMGERDGDFARETIMHARNYLATVTFNESTGDITRQKGMVMTMGAIVYDWCYDYMTEHDKKFFIQRFKEICAIKEVKYPPSPTIHAVGGHMGEYEINRDMLSTGIACYDEDTQLYDYASGIIFNRFDEPRKLFNKSGNHPNGSDYGQFRASCEAYADILYSRMYPQMDHIYGNDAGKIPLRYLYSRLPDGMFMVDGDSYAYSSRQKIHVNDGTYMMYLILGNLYEEPYARGEYLRQLSLGSGTKENFWTVIFANPEAESSLTSELPLAYATTYPLTSIWARTGWQSGMDSDTAMVQMKAYERTVWDHMHSDAGHFQIYYKGTLALDAGMYQGYDPVSGELLDYGSLHDYNFNKRSVAHNVVTVTDPSESFGIYENDGGQKRPQNSIAITDYETLMSDGAIRAETKGIYTGPQKKTPAFSYLKTDITSAYSSSKINSNVRQMVFMDLFDDDYPAAFVVFDRVVSKNALFRKKWNLNSVEKPVVEGNVTTITRTEHGYNGKLVNKTLIPSDGIITTVEGCSVNGTDYTILDKRPTDWHATEQGGWRIEVSPKNASEEDLFLNAMYVTDADSKAPAPEMTKRESGNFIGVSIKDRLVMFSKNGNIANEEFRLDVASETGNKTLCLISDVAPGVWNIKELGINTEVKKDENVLCFEAPAGVYTLIPVNQKATAVTFEDVTKPEIGDFIIHYNNSADNEQQYMNCTVANIEKNGVAFVPVRTIFERISLYSGSRAGAKFVSYNEDTQTAVFENADGIRISIKAGSKSYTYGGKTVVISDGVFENSGTMYVSLSDFKDFLKLNSVSYDSTAKLLKIAS